MVCLRSQPPSTQSSHERRTARGFSSGHTALTAVTTSTQKRIRFSKEPPYCHERDVREGRRGQEGERKREGECTESVRWLERGDKKE